MWEYFKFSIEGLWSKAKNNAQRYLAYVLNILECIEQLCDQHLVLTIVFIELSTQKEELIELINVHLYRLFKETLS